jgi:acid phosphatase
MRNLQLLSGLFILFFFSSCSSETEGPGLPDSSKPDHVVIVVEENHGYSQIMHSKYAPYINRLAGESAVFVNAYAITHPSQPNYLALFSGSTQGVASDDCNLKKEPFTTENLGAALLRAGYSFTGYSEALPAPGSTECTDTTNPGFEYARKHAPWVNWQGDGINGLPASANQPFSSFPEDFNELPTLSFVIPDLGNNMHNTNLEGGDSGAIQRADRWLSDHLSAYVEWANTHNSLLILTFDEDDQTNPENNRILTFFKGPMVRPGLYKDNINHYRVLRTLEDLYHLPRSGDAGETGIKGIWRYFRR